MVEEIDIYRSAMIFVEKYGENAKIEAAQSAVKQQGLDLEGLAVWCKIVQAIDDIQNKKAPGCVN